MIKGKKFERIKITKDEYKKLEKSEIKLKSAKLLRRVQAFKLIHLGWKYNQIAKFLKVTNDTITDWIDIYQSKGINGLINLKYKGGQSRLTVDQLKELKQKAKKGKFKVAKEVKQYIEKNFNINYHLNHVHKICKKNFNYPLNKLD